MADWPVGSDSTLARTLGITPSMRGNTLATEVLSGSPAHTKMAWGYNLPLTTATGGLLTFDAYGFLIGLINFTPSSTQLIDIAFGANPNEKVVLSNLMFEGLANRLAVEVFIPLPIPSGTIVSATSQATTAYSYSYLTLTPLGQGFLPSPWLGNVQTLGVTATAGLYTKGTSITPGDPYDTKGSWYELLPVTGTGLARPCSQLLLMVGSRADAVVLDTRYLLDIGIGPSSSEVVPVYSNIFLGIQYNSDTLQQSAFGPYPFSAPAGTRIWARSQYRGTSTADKLINVAAYAFG